MSTNLKRHTGKELNTMTLTQMRNHMMSHGTASSCAEAASSRAQSAQASFNTIMLILDAIIMASIIICRLSALAILGLVLVLVLVGLLITKNCNMPWMRTCA